MTPADRIRLQHMRDACQKILAFSSTRQREDLDTDEMYMLAITRLIEIVGEAAKAIPEQIRAASPQVPWRAIGRTRDHLIHGYFNVDLDIVWTIVATDVPVLLAEMERLLALPADGAPS